MKSSCATAFPKPKEIWTEKDEWEEEHDGHVNWEDWEWVGDVVDTASMNRHHGRNNLEELIFNIPEMESSNHFRQFGGV